MTFRNFKLLHEQFLFHLKHCALFLSLSTESPEMRNLTQLTNEGEQIFAQCCLQFAGKKMEPSFSWYLNENNKNQALEEVIVSRPQMENPNTSFCEVIEVTSHRRLHNQTIMCLMPKTSNRTNSGVLYVYCEYDSRILTNVYIQYIDTYSTQLRYCYMSIWIHCQEPRNVRLNSHT